MDKLTKHLTEAWLGMGSDKPALGQLGQGTYVVPLNTGGDEAAAGSY